MEKYPIIILPGWRLRSARFKPLSDAFEKAGYITYTIDFPGFEQGEVLIRAWNLTDYVKFVQKYLRQHNITKAIFVCHSFGGRVALKLLSQEPQKARALVISGTPGFRTFSLRNLLASFLAKIGKILIFLPPFFLFRNQLGKVLYRISGSYDYYQTTGFLRETFKNIVKERLDGYMAKIRVPTLLIWGEKDKLAGLKIAKRMKNLLRGSQLETIPDASHNFLYKQPDVFVDKVVNFLNKL